jgi:hypothetical protein
MIAAPFFGIFMMPLLSIAAELRGWGRSSDVKGRARIEIEAEPNIEDQTRSIALRTRAFAHVTFGRLASSKARETIP